MEYLNGVQYNFTFSYGVSRTGKTVTIAVLNTNGTVRATGHTIGSVVELSDGVYGVDITFDENFSGYVRGSNTTDGFELYQPITIIPDFRTDITNILKINKNRWLIESNQLKFYDDDGTTVIYTFDLKKAGAANDGTDPDERVPV